jgi:hypothetical protein
MLLHSRLAEQLLDYLYDTHPLSHFPLLYNIFITCADTSYLISALSPSVSIITHSRRPNTTRSASSQHLTCRTKRSTDCNLSYLSFTGAQLFSAVSTDMNNEELSVFICQSYYSMEHKMVQEIQSIL